MLRKFRSSFVLGAVVLTAMLLAACAAQAAPASTTASSTEVPTPSSPTNMPINVANNATLGSFLVDGQGMTIYIYTKDKPGVSNCTGACLTAWPPVTAALEEDVVAGAGVTATIGTITDSNGVLQVTVNNMPVYYFAKDTKPGDVNGQGVNNAWYVLDPTGKPIVSAGTAMPAATQMSAATEMPAATTAATAMAPAATTAATAMAPAAPVGADTMPINVVNNPTLGNILVDEQGMTIYVYLKDTPGMSNCTGACLTTWPAVTVAPEVDPVAGAGVTATIDAIAATDGSLQVTVNGMPVYYFAKDAKPGDVNGQGVNSVWYVLDAAGNPVKTMP